MSTPLPTTDLEAAVQPLLTSCREWKEETANHCNEPAEFLLWGKLIPKEGLGPRCYDCAATHVHYSYLLPDAGAAVVDLRPIRKAVGK